MMSVEPGAWFSVKLCHPDSGESCQVWATVYAVRCVSPGNEIRARLKSYVKTVGAAREDESLVRVIRLGGDSDRHDHNVIGVVPPRAIKVAGPLTVTTPPLSSRLGA